MPPSVHRLPCTMAGKPLPPIPPSAHMTLTAVGSGREDAEDDRGQKFKALPLMLSTTGRSGAPSAGQQGAPTPTQQNCGDGCSTLRMAGYVDVLAMSACRHCGGHVAWRILRLLRKAACANAAEAGSSTVTVAAWYICNSPAAACCWYAQAAAAAATWRLMPPPDTLQHTHTHAHARKTRPARATHMRALGCFCAHAHESRPALPP